MERLSEQVLTDRVLEFETAANVLADTNPEFAHISLSSTREACLGENYKCPLVSGKQTTRVCEVNSQAMLYSNSKGPQTVTWIKKNCPKCDGAFYTGWWAQKTKNSGPCSSVFHFLDETLNRSVVFTSTAYTSFDVEFLVRCDYQMIYHGASFNGLCNEYNTCIQL